MQPMDELLINFGDDTTDVDLFTSKITMNSSGNENMEEGNSSSLFNSFWGNQTNLLDGLDDSLFKSLNKSPTPPNLTVEKEQLIKKILASQTLLRRKLDDLNHLKKEYASNEKELQLLTHYVENLLQSKVVRNVQ